MDVSALIPAPDTIPVPWGWFWFLLILTFTLHLIIMNTMLGISILALISHLTTKKKKQFPTKTVSQKLPFIIAFTVNSGVAPLLFLQVLYGQFIYTAFILTAVYTLLIVLFLMAAYYGAYIYDFKFDDLSVRTRNILLSGIVALFLVIAFFFSNIMSLMQNPESWVRYFSNAAGTLLSLTDPTLAPRFFHVVLASVSNGSLFLALLYERRAAGGDKTALHKQRIVMKWFSIPLMVNLLVGGWYLFSQPNRIVVLFMGHDIYAAILLIIGIAGGILSLFFGIRSHVKACTAATLATLVDMVLIRDLIRHFSIRPYFQVSDLEVTSQYTPMIFFFAVAVISTGAVIYMIRQAVIAGKEA